MPILVNLQKIQKQTLLVDVTLAMLRLNQYILLFRLIRKKVKDLK